MKKDPCTSAPCYLTVDKTGRHVLVANYGSGSVAALPIESDGHNTIAVFAIDQESGKLTSVEHEATLGRNPRNFGIDPSGRYLLAANQSSNSVVVFRINPETGALTPTGETASVPRPVCLKFVEPGS